MRKPLRVNVDPLAAVMDGDDPESCQDALRAGMPLARALEAEFYNRSTGNRSTGNAGQDYTGQGYAPDHTDHSDRARRRHRPEFDDLDPEQEERLARRTASPHPAPGVGPRRARSQAVPPKPERFPSYDRLLAQSYEIGAADHGWDGWSDRAERRSGAWRLVQITAISAFVAIALAIGGGAMVLLLFPVQDGPAGDQVFGPVSAVGESVFSAETAAVPSPKDVIATAEPELPNAATPDAPLLPTVRSREVAIERAAPASGLATSRAETDQDNGTTWLEPRRVAVSPPVALPATLPQAAGAAAPPPGAIGFAPPQAALGIEPFYADEGSGGTTIAMPSPVRDGAGSPAAAPPPAWESASAAVPQAAGAAGGLSGADPVGTGYVTSDVNLRTGPENAASVITIIREGSAIELVACEMWCEAVYKGERGWVFHKYVDDSGVATAAGTDPIAN